MTSPLLPSASRKEAPITFQPHGLTPLTGAAAADLRSLQIKLTYVGTQTKTVPTLAITSFQHVLVMEWFAEQPPPNAGHAADRSNVWSLSVAPEELTRIVPALATLDTGPAPGASGPPFLALMVVLRESRLGRFDFERALDQRAAMALYAAMRGATSPDNGLARRVFDLHRALMGL